MRHAPLFLASLIALAPTSVHAFDSNGNGMSDVWEMLYHQLELFPATDARLAPGADADGDGQSNLLESLAGTDPFSGIPPQGLFQMRIARAPWPPDTFRLTLPLSAAGKTYTFATSPDLSSGSWTPAEPMTGTGDNLTIDVQPLDEQTHTLSEKAFFRAQIADQPNPGGPFSPWELATLAAHPGIAAALQPLVNPPDPGDPETPQEPPPVPNSDSSGPKDPYDAAPFDDKVDWYRTPEARYLHIAVDGNTAGFEAVAVSDSGKILFTRTAPVTDYATDAVGLVWDPAAESARRFSPVMFAPAGFELKILKTTWAVPEGGTQEVGTTTIATSSMPLPAPVVPNSNSNPYVELTVRMKAISDDGSLLADVDYLMNEHDGNTEKSLRAGAAQVAFVWKGTTYTSCRMLGTDRGYSGSPDDFYFTEDHAVGFYRNTNATPPADEAIITHETIRRNNSSQPILLKVENHPLGDIAIPLPWPGYPGHIPGLPLDPQITRSGRILIRNRVSASELNHIVCGQGVTPAIPLASGLNVGGISDLPDGTPGWGIGQTGGDFRVRNGSTFESIASLAGVLAFDRQGNGIGNGRDGRHIWRNAQWHTLEDATGLASLSGKAPRRITASGLIWIANETATANSLLIPVEVVAPTLDYHEQETEYGIMGAEELKVAKMEHSLDAQGVLHHDLDRHRFYVRIPSRLGGAAVVAKLGTVENPEAAYNDPATEIPLTANSYQQESLSQILVSDEVDDSADGPDEQPGDRTHRVQLGGNVEVSSIKIGPNTYPFSMKVPVKVKKRLNGTIIMVGNTGEYQADIETFNRVAKERYAQVGVDFNFDIVGMALPAGFPDENNVRFLTSEVSLPDGGKKYLPNPDFAALVDKAIQDNKRKNITLFVVRNMTGGDRGRALTKDILASDFHVYGNVAILSAEDMIRIPDPNRNQPERRAWFTIAHEVGHILTNAGHYAPPDPDYDGPPKLANYGGDPPPFIDQNIMKEGTSNLNELISSKRFRHSQEIMALPDLLENPQ